MQGAMPSFNQISTGGANPLGIIEDISTRGLKTVRIGELAGKLATGQRNVFTGYGAAANGSSVNNTVLIGYESGRDAKTLSSATFVGAFTGASADRSHETTLVGYAAGELMKDCSQCVGVGAYTLREATALQSTAVGCRALERSLDADYNVGIGAECMQNNRSGSYNTAVGFQAMRAAFTSSECVMVGAYAGYSNALGKGITAIGYRSCEFMEDGQYSVAVGAYSLQNSTYTSNSVAIGPFSGKAAEAENAVLIGTNVAKNAKAISGSVIIGESAAANHEGNDTVIIGARAASTMTGNDCVIIGADALTGLDENDIAQEDIVAVNALATVAIGRNVAPTLRNSSNNVLIGHGANSFRSALTRGIAIGAAATTTNDNSISIGSDIENERISSILLGNTLTSDSDNSVLIGRDIRVTSITFFKNPLQAGYTTAVARDALTKFGASNIDYTDILRPPGSEVPYLVATAGYLTVPVTTPSTYIDLLPSPVTNYNLREHAPDNYYAFAQGIALLSGNALINTTSPVSSSSNIWEQTVDSSFTADMMQLSSQPISTFNDPYQENHSFSAQLPYATTVNIMNFEQNAVTVPLFVPKRVVYPSATTETSNIVIPSQTINASIILNANLTSPAPLAYEEVLPQDSSKCNILFEVVQQPTYGYLSNIATRNPTYTLPIEAAFATHDNFSLRPVQVMTETYTQSKFALKNYQRSNAYSLTVYEPQLFLPNALPASNIIDLNASIITYGPVPSPTPDVSAINLRLTEIPTNSKWHVPTIDGQYNSYTPSDVTTMVSENIDAYPDSQNLTYYNTAKTSITTDVANIQQSIIQPTVPHLNSLLSSLKTLSNFIPVARLPTYSTAYGTASNTSQIIKTWAPGSNAFESLWPTLSNQSTWVVNNIFQERVETTNVASILPLLSEKVTTVKTSIDDFVTNTSPLFNTLKGSLSNLSTYIPTSSNAAYAAALNDINTESADILSNGTKTTFIASKWINIQNKTQWIFNALEVPDPQKTDMLNQLATINTTVQECIDRINAFVATVTPLFQTLVSSIQSLSNDMSTLEKPQYNSNVLEITTARDLILNYGTYTSSYGILYNTIYDDCQSIILMAGSGASPLEKNTINNSLSNINVAINAELSGMDAYTSYIASLMENLFFSAASIQNNYNISDQALYESSLATLHTSKTELEDPNAGTTAYLSTYTTISSATNTILTLYEVPVPPDMTTERNMATDTTMSIDPNITTVLASMDTYITSSTPEFTSLTSNLKSLSNVIPSAIYSTYTTNLGIVTNNSNLLLSRNLSSFEYAPKFASLSNSSTWIIDNIVIPDPPEVATVWSSLSSLQTLIFTSWGIRDVTTNLVNLYNAILADPPQIASTQWNAYTTAPAGTLGKVGAAQYALWWSKYTIPRAFQPILDTSSPSTSVSYLQASIPNSIIASSSIKVRLPTSITPSTTTASLSNEVSRTIRINAAQPDVLSSWDIQTDWYVDIQGESGSTTQTALPDISLSNMLVLVPPQYGSLTKKSVIDSSSLSNWLYTPSHPFNNDDAALLVTSFAGASQVINVTFNRINPSLFVQNIAGPYKIATESKVWTGFEIDVISTHEKSLSNLHIEYGSENNTYGTSESGAGQFTIPLSSNYVPVIYNSLNGLSTYTSNIQKTRTLTSTKNLNASTLSNEINVYLTYTLSNVSYDFDNNATITKSSTRPLGWPYTYYEPKSTNVAQRIDITSNVNVTIIEQRARSYDTYTDSNIGSIERHSLSNWIDGDSIPQFAYSSNIFKPSIKINTYTIETQNGTTYSSSYVRNLTGTSNIFNISSAITLRRHKLATNSSSFNTFSAIPMSMSTSNEMGPFFVKRGVGPVSEFTVNDVNNSNILVPITTTSQLYYAVSLHGSSLSSNITVQGFNIGGFTRTTASSRVIEINPETYIVPLTSIITSSSFGILQADDGFVTNERAYIPNAPHNLLPSSQKSRTLTYFTWNGTNINSQITTLTFTVSPRHHPYGQVINISSQHSQNTLSSRTFTPATSSITFKGFSTSGWQLINRLTSAAALTNATINYADILAGTWYISPASSAVPYATTNLNYTLSGSGTTLQYPIKTYARDAFPYESDAVESVWQWQRLGQLPAQSTHVLKGPFWDSIRNMATSAVIMIELMQSPTHCFFYDPVEPNTQQMRFPYTSVTSNKLTVIPRTPLDFKNETISFRILLDERPSPVYTMQFHPFWSVIPEMSTDGTSSPSLASIFLSPSLVELGYNWQEVSQASDFVRTYQLSSSLSNQESIGPFQYSTERTFIPRAPLQSPTVKSGVTLSFTIDQADRHTFNMQQLLSCVDNIQDTTFFYLTKSARHGLLLNASNNRPATRFSSADSIYYQHDGTTNLDDDIALHVSSCPFDVSPTALQITFKIRPIPYVIALKQDKIFASSLAELSVQRSFESSLFTVSPPYVNPDNTPTYIHILGSNLLIPSTTRFSVTNYDPSPVKYQISPSIVNSTNPPLTFTFTVNATPTKHLNPLENVQQYSHLFKYTMSSTLNHHVSVNEFANVQQPSRYQGVTYEIDNEDPSSKNFVDRTVGIYIEYKPTYGINYSSSNVLASSQVTSIKTFKYVFEALTNTSTEPIFRFTVSHYQTIENNTIQNKATVHAQTKTSSYEAQNFDVPDANSEGYHTLYFENNEEFLDTTRNAALYIGYSFDQPQSENEKALVFKGSNKIPVIDIENVTSIRFLYDLQDPLNYTEYAEITRPYGPLLARFTLSNYATSLQLRDNQIRINTNTLSEESGGEPVYDPTKYNVIIGNGVEVRGVDNICIGSAFTTSGQNSIILGNNIGIRPGSQNTNEIYESIILGSVSFADAFVRDVIAIGKNIYNDLFDVELERVADFLSYKPVLIGNDMTRDMLDFHVNVGNTFLTTGRYGKQVYLGTGGESAAIGYSSNLGLTKHKLNVNGTMQTTGIYVNTDVIESFSNESIYTKTSIIKQAASNEDWFTNANKHDLLVCTSHIDQNILLGNQSNVVSKVGIYNDRVEINVPNLVVDNVSYAHVPRGVITMWSGSISAIPIGWVICNGGNGTPDLRNKFVIGAGSSYAVGGTGGATTVTLTIANLPPHNHTGTTSSEGSHAHTVYIAVDAVGTGDRISGADTSGSDEGISTKSAGTTDTQGAHTHTFTTNTVGSGTAFSILPPYYALAYIMKS